MLTVSFIITMAVAGIVFITVSRWQAVGGDRQKLADRAATLDVLARIVEQHADTPVNTDQGWQNRPPEVQRRVARPLPVSFNVVGASTGTVAPPVSPRQTTVSNSPHHPCDADHSTTTAAPADPPSPPIFSPAGAVRSGHRPDGVVHRRLMRLSSNDVPPDPDDPELPISQLRSHTSSTSHPTTPQTTDGIAVLAGAPPAGQGKSGHSRHRQQHRRHQHRHQHRRRRLATVAAGVALVAAAGMASNWDDDAPVASSATANDTSLGDAPALTQMPPEQVAPLLPLPPSLVVGDVAAFGVVAPFTLDLAADQPSWVQVRNRSGQVLFEQTLQPGESTQVDVDQPIAVRTGNPAGLAVTAGFMPLDHPRPAGQPITLHLG